MGASGDVNQICELLMKSYNTQLCYPTAISIVKVEHQLANLTI